MAQKESWTPSAEDRRMLTEHLFYEVQMTFDLARRLTMGAGTHPDLTLWNAQIEAFTLHLRQLIDFFWCERERFKSGDAFAADYFDEGEWATLRPARPAILDSALKRKVGWGVAHLTYERAWVTPADKHWDVQNLARALAPAVVRFVDDVDHAQFGPGFVNGMKTCALIFLDAFGS